jgi:hypothetical protein
VPGRRAAEQGFAAIAKDQLRIGFTGPGALVIGIS